MVTWKRNKPSLPSYMVEAFVRWCDDLGVTAHILCRLDRVDSWLSDFSPDPDFITLNVSSSATDGTFKQEEPNLFHFTVRFGGVPKEIWIPSDAIVKVATKESKHKDIGSLEDVYLSYDLKLTDDLGQIRSDKNLTINKPGDAPEKPKVVTEKVGDNVTRVDFSKKKT